jgi:hypothetical protein
VRTCARASLVLSCSAHCRNACCTASAMDVASSPMYSFPVPCDGRVRLTVSGGGGVTARRQRPTARSESTRAAGYHPELMLTLKGIFVDTMLMKTPTRSRLGSILYASHFILLACRVATSLPASNNSGMRLAKRKTLMPCVSVPAPVLVSVHSRR